MTIGRFLSVTVCLVLLGSAAEADTAPVIEFQPTPQVAILGATARLTVIAGGDPVPSYQWRRNGVDLVDDARVSGATTDVLAIRGVLSGDAGAYSVVVSNGSGSVTSVDAALTTVAPQAGDVDPGFDPGASVAGSVVSIALQPDGKVLLGGWFMSAADAARGGIARLNADGSTDHTLGNGLMGASGNPPGFVAAIAVQSDKKVVIGGEFILSTGQVLAAGSRA
jgi:hypothetical protein